MTDTGSSFYAQDASARTSWRLTVLMGANSRTYKFALGTALLDAAGRGHSEIPLAELATPYALELARRLHVSNASCPAGSHPCPPRPAIRGGRASAEALQERLDVDGFRLDGDADARLWRWWQANDLDTTTPVKPPYAARLYLPDRTSRSNAQRTVAGGT